MSKKVKLLVIAVTLLALAGAGVGVALARGAGDAQAAAKNLPPELQPLAEQVKATLEQLRDPASRVKELMQQVKENRRTMRDLVNRIGKDNLGEVEEQLRQLVRDAREDRDILQEAKQIKQDPKNSLGRVRRAVRAGDIEGAKRVLEQDLARLTHSGEVLEKAAQAMQARIDAQNALIEQLRSRTDS